MKGDFKVQMNWTSLDKPQKSLQTDTAEIAITPEDENSQVYELLKKRLPLISCGCGAEILVVPDLRAMNRAIKTHVVEHRKRERNAKRNIITYGNISQLLSQLTLVKISQQKREDGCRI